VEKTKKFQTGNVLIISFAHLVHDVYSSFLSPLLPLLIEKMNLSYSLVGLLSVFQRIPSLLNPVVGILAEKTSLHYLVIIAPALTTISMSLLGVAPQYTVLALLLIIMGISSTLFHVPAPVMIKQVAGTQTGKGMSYFMLGGELARTLGPLTVLGAVSIWGLEGTYKLIPVGLLSSFLLYFKFKNIKIESNQTENKHYNFLLTFRKHLNLFVLISGIIFFRGMIRNSLTIFLPTYLVQKGESLWTGGIALSILQLAGAAGTLFAGILSDKIGRKTTLKIAAILIPILMGLFICSKGIYLFASLVCLGFVLFAYGPVVLALFQDLDSEHPAFVNSIYMTLNFTINSLVTLFIGILADMISLENTFRISVLFSLVGIPLIFLLPKLKK